MKSLYSILLMYMLAAILITGCGKTVKLIGSDSVTALSGNWNDADSRLVAEEVLNTCLTAPWYKEKSKDGKPVITVGQIRNSSHEHIDTDTFINDIQRVLANSGARQQLRAEIGADIMLTGEIAAIIDQNGGEQVKFYQVDIMLRDSQTQEILWIGGKKHKKSIEHSLQQRSK